MNIGSKLILFVIHQQILIGMLLATGFLIPWKQHRSYFRLRITVGIVLMFVLSETVRVMALPVWTKLLLDTVMVLGIVWLCIECSFIHAVFYTTCAYAVQHISSKLAYMFLVWRSIQYGRLDSIFLLVILLTVNILVGLTVYLQFTRRLSAQKQLLFDSAKAVFYSGIFLIVAVFLSVVLENGFDTASKSYLSSYFALNALCIVFAVTILVLEFSNCNIKSLEHENAVLGQLLEYDKLQYQQAKIDMEKINIRYHDLKQQYSRATEEDRVKLEEEMANINLTYVTGNKALDITLMHKAGICQKEGIRLICSADGSCISHMKQYHIYALLGNALDNAIECLRDVKNITKKVITVNISQYRDMVVIRVENYTPKMPVMHNGTLVTTKTNQTREHGYGTKSIQNIAEIYGGTASFFVEDQIFYMVVTIPKETVL